MDGLNPYLKSGRNARMDKLWSMILQKDKEIVEEILECRKRQTQTPRYATLAADMRKLKAEYESTKGTGTFDPSSQAHHDLVEKQVALGEVTGKAGPDTHHGIAGELDKP